MDKEYIERGELIADLNKFAPEAYSRAVDLVISNQPAADVVEVKRGRWTLHDDGSGTCDQCHFTQKHIWDDDGWQNYCGVCGADMRERRGENG